MEEGPAGGFTEEYLLPVLADLLSEQKKTNELMLEQKDWFIRRNAIERDQPIYDWNEAVVPPGYLVQFILTVPEGFEFYFQYPNITYHDDTIYYVWIDGVWEPTMSDSLQDFGDHSIVFDPPKRSFATAEVWALNNSVVDRTYSCFFRGFLRRPKWEEYKVINTEEVSQAEKEMEN